MADNTIFLLHRTEALEPEMAELINYRPHWIISKGNLIFLMVAMLLLALTWFIRYPDVIQGPVRLVAINAPKLLTAKTEGKLEKLLVTNEQEVQEGQPLAYLQSTARHQQALVLQRWIGEVEAPVINGNLEIIISKPLPLLNELGELQSAYQEFQNTLQESLQLIAGGYYQQKKKDLLQDLQYIAAIQHNTRRQKQLLQQDMELQQIDLRAKESLTKDRVIAPLEFNQEKSKVIAKEQILEQLSAQDINNTITSQTKKKEILDLQKYISDQHQKFRSALLSLKSKVEEWMQQYIVVAPVAGKVLFVSFLQENQYLNNNQELFYVQPPQSLYYGELIASQHGLGKMKAGQRVMIRVESYPSDEYGYLTGKVDYITHIPTRKDSFLVKVELPRGLQTNFGNTMIFRNNLSAKAEVITDNRRLFERFLGRLRQALQR